MVTHPLGTTSVFTSLSRASSDGLARVATAAEGSGFDALWVADVRGDLSFLATCLEATSRLVVGSAVLSMWDLEAKQAADYWTRAESIGAGRAVLGIGVSHPVLAARAGQTYERPLATLRGYLDVLDDPVSHVPADLRILGANGPAMLALAGERSAGAVTQIVTPERTAEQRALLGKDAAVLATEVKIVVAGDRAEARRLGRANLTHYLGMPSYRKNLVSMGFTDDDLAGSGSDRLVDALVAGPDPSEIRARIAEQRDAGADHVCLHVLADGPGAHLEQWRALSDILQPEGAP